jgi:hypothetical protein
MFTHNPVTPIRLEILVDLLRRHPRGLLKKDVYRLLQPSSLREDVGSGSPAYVTVGAGIELGLIDQDGSELSINSLYRKEADSRESILKAIDLHVLGGLGIEKYFALFYAYYLGLGKEAGKRNQDLANQFNVDVFDGEQQENPFNETKLTGLHRWFSYVGLGWYDPSGKFQPNPFERISRVLPAIFSNTSKLEADEFMTRLAMTCPEVDGGEIFQKANRGWKSSDKRCSLGLSHALIELHEDQVVRLDCPTDAGEGLAGWSLNEASPPRDDSIKSDRFTTVEWKAK